MKTDSADHIENMINIRKIGLYIFLFLLVSHQGFAQRLTATEKNFIQKKGPIIFASQSVYPPFEFVEKEGEHNGMCIELVRWISTELGFKTHFTDASFIDAQEAIKSGQADVLTSLFYSQKRDTLFDFSSTVFKVPAYIYIASDRPDIKSLADLNGKIIAMQRGDYAKEFLESQNISFQTLDANNFAEATDMVIAGHADALIGDEQIVQFHLYSNNLIKKIKKVGDPVFVGLNCMAVKEGNTVLLSLMQKGIELARKKGVLERINRKWLGVTYQLQTSLWEKYKFLFSMIVGSLSLVLVMMWLWNIRLKKEVLRRTEALMHSERKLRIANEGWERTFDSVPDLIAIVDENYNVKKMNRPMADSLGIDKISCNLPKCHILFHGQPEPPSYCPHAKLLKDGQAHTAEIYEEQLGVNFFVRVSPLLDSTGQLEGCVHIARDITENKLTEKLMRTQRDLSTALIHVCDFNQALDICLNAALKIKEANCGGIYLMDSETGGLTLRVHRDMPPDFVEAVSSLDKNSPQAKLVSKEQPIFQSYREMLDCYGLSADDKKNRDSFGLRAVAVVPMSHEGKIIGCLNVASSTDDTFSEFSRSSLEAITGQMAAALVKIQTDQALQVSQRNLKTLFESLDDYLFILDDTGRIIETNPVVEKRLGYTVDQLTTMHVTQVHPPERRQEAIEIVHQMLAGQAEFCPIPLLARDGSSIPVETKVTPGTWNGRPALFGISRDIRRRLEAEEAQKVSEARLRAAIDTIDEGFVIYDNNDRMVMCNNKYLDIYKDSTDLIQPGAKFEEIIRQGAYRGQYAEARGDVEHWISERMAHHQHCDSNLEQQLNDGRWLRIVERKMENGSTVGFRVDITDLKRSEALLRKALQEKGTLLREIHHRVKNNLAVISSMLNLQVKHHENKVVRKSLMESRDRVRSMALIHETLHQTNDLSIVKLKDYVRKLIRDLSSVYDNFSYQFKIKYEFDDVDLDLNQAVYCDLIINELVTNSLKYAFVGKERGTIHISAKQIGNEEIALSVKDDGIGLPPTFDWRNAGTLGLRLISLMVEQLHGSLELNSQNGLETVIQWKSSLVKAAPGMVS